MDIGGITTRSKGKLPDLIHEAALLDQTFPDLPVSLSSFFCLICDEPYTSEDQIRSHYDTHVVDKPFECPDCADCFLELDLFLEHIQDSCSPLLSDEQFELCGKKVLSELETSFQEITQQQQEQVLQDSDYESHESAVDNGKTEPDDEYQCVLCVKGFASMEQYKEHCESHGSVFADLELKSRRGRKERPFKCQLCSTSFTKKKTLHIHKQKIHLGLTFEMEGNENSTQGQPKQSQDGPFVCALCQAKYPRKRDLKEHILSSHTIMPAQCKYCSKIFDLESSMQKHVARHEGPSPIPCSTCQIPYASQKEMEKHKRTTHSPYKAHTCKECGKSFTKANDLLKHTRIHLGIRPYTCQICEKSFTHQTSLRNHQAVHSGEKPFICNYCGASFSYAGNLKVHIRSHTNERPYVCTYCCKSFARTANLNEHLRTHTQEKPHKCPYPNCEKQFASSSTLSKHKKTHSGVKSHVCGVCNKAFTEMAHLSKHLRIHTGEKPFKCTICLKDFRRSDTLKVHYKTHSKPRKGDYGDVPPPFATIQVPVPQQIHVQFESIEMPDNIGFLESVPITGQYEIHAIPNYTNEQEHLLENQSLIMEPITEDQTISYTYWAPVIETEHQNLL